MGLAPTGVWRVPRPSPIAIGGPFPQAKALPSPPSPSLFPPHPLALFAMLRESGTGRPTQSGVGGRGPRVQGGGGGGPSSGAWGRTHIWGYSITSIGNQPASCRGLSGPADPKGRKSLENIQPGTPKKSPKSEEKSKHSPDPETFWRLFRSPGRRPRETFPRLF